MDPITTTLAGLSLKEEYSVSLSSATKEMHIYLQLSHLSRLSYHLLQSTTLETRLAAKRTRLSVSSSERSWVTRSATLIESEGRALTELRGEVSHLWAERIRAAERSDYLTSADEVKVESEWIEDTGSNSSVTVAVDDLRAKQLSALQQIDEDITASGHKKDLVRRHMKILMRQKDSLERSLEETVIELEKVEEKAFEEILGLVLLAAQS